MHQKILPYPCFSHDDARLASAASEPSVASHGHVRSTHELRSALIACLIAKASDET